MCVFVDQDVKLLFPKKIIEQDTTKHEIIALCLALCTDP